MMLGIWQALLASRRSQQSRREQESAPKIMRACSFAKQSRDEKVHKSSRGAQLKAELETARPPPIRVGNCSSTSNSSRKLLVHLKAELETARQPPIRVGNCSSTSNLSWKPFVHLKTELETAIPIPGRLPRASLNKIQLKNCSPTTAPSECNR